MYSKLAAVISESGIWGGTRKESHAFLLSPSVFQITEAQRRALCWLGFALYDCLMGLSHIAVIAYDRSLNYRDIWLLMRNVFSTGVPKVYLELQGMNIRHIPALLKVDLMVDQNGHFKIAEIDGHNKHGLGYSTLGLRFREAVHPNAQSLPGAVKRLSEEVKRLGFDEIKLFYADQERFYIPEFEVVRQELIKYGINCTVVSEMDADQPFLQSGLFLDLPFLYHRPDLYQTIVQAYGAGEVSFVIPPKPFLGAKGVMALLRNDGGDEHLEALLQTFIKKQSLDLVRQYVPETLLVGKRAEGLDSIRDRVSHKRYVLKESISSGMKGTVFSDDGNFDSVLSGACKSNMGWILQEEVQNQAQTFSWFEHRNGGDPVLNTHNDWFMRVTAHYVNRQLADMMITARRDKAVHGAKDCIQIGTIIC